ncbi:MAG: hypothetical protein ACE1ZK_00485, partial [Nitrospirales bacterium]
MIDGCEQYDGLLMRIASLGFAHGPRYGASLVMRRPVSSGSSVGEKTACGTCGRVPWVFYDHNQVGARESGIAPWGVVLQEPIEYFHAITSFPVTTSEARN